MSQESPTLAEIFRVVFDYLSVRDDAVLFGSHAVNAYVERPRMTADIDILSVDASRLAEDVRDLLAERFSMAARVRIVAQGRGFRVYQVRRPPQHNRHLVDVRQIDRLPHVNRIFGICVIAPADLVVAKVTSLAARRHTDKGISDRLDLHRMLLAFPEFRSPSGPVEHRLIELSPDLVGLWHEVLSEQIERSNDDEF